MLLFFRTLAVRVSLLSLTITCLVASVPAQTRSPSTVLTGIDVLEKTNFAALRNLADNHQHALRIGIVTNQSGLDRHGRRTIDILNHDASQSVTGLHVAALFSPEHGLAGAVDTAHANGGKDYTIAEGVDPPTGLRVTSLFGNTEQERRPKIEQLRDLDAVVIDLQDVGVRFYTYETVVGYFLEAAAKTGTTIIILDRPNPIRGDRVQGATSPDRPAYINYMPIPLRHGLTLGELARFICATKKIKASLIVIAMQGWQRSMWFDETGLPWINPSPNLRSMVALILYPATGLLEAANISIGRGSESTFEKFGAPWMDALKVSSALRERAIPGVQFVPVDFTPASPFKYAGQLCHGVQIDIVNRDLLDSPRLGVAIAQTLHSLYPTEFELARIDPVKASDAVLDGIRSGRNLKSIAIEWRADVLKFEALRRSILLY